MEKERQMLAALTFSFTIAMVGDGITLHSGPLVSGRLDGVDCSVFLTTRKYFKIPKTHVCLRDIKVDKWESLDDFSLAKAGHSPNLPPPNFPAIQYILKNSKQFLTCPHYNMCIGLTMLISRSWKWCTNEDKL